MSVGMRAAGAAAAATGGRNRRGRRSLRTGTRRGRTSGYRHEAFDLIAAATACHGGSTSHQPLEAAAAGAALIVVDRHGERFAIGRHRVKWSAGVRSPGTEASRRKRGPQSARAASRDARHRKYGRCPRSGAT